MCIRYVFVAATTPTFQNIVASKSRLIIMGLSVCCFVFMLILKTILGVGLVWYAARSHNRNIDSAAAMSKKMDATYSADVKKQRKDFIQELHSVERFQVYKGRVIG